MNNSELEAKVGLVSGALVGENLMSEFERLLVADPLLGQIFSGGKKIFSNKKPNLNSKILPSLEMWWGTERQESPNGYLSGGIEGRIMLPPQVSGNLIAQRLFMRAILRYMDSDPFCEIFKTVPGLIEIGVNCNITYNRIVKIENFEAPAILIQIPYRFDLAIFKRETPEVDHDGYLNAELFEDFLTTIIKVEDDNTGVTIHEYSEDINGG